ncbi:MAG: ABC transporter permease subunit [Flammeovirgaceae bacterium]|nr:ABC transporter permease subunit [Flammeovirgaceae bacterium]
MKSTWVIAKRELGAYFDSLIAYVLIILFLGLSGIFTWFFVRPIFLVNQANLQFFFGFIAYWALFLFIPTITMRVLAEEKKAGTIELLSTKAITDWEIVLGKFLSCLILILISLACTLPYYITLSMLGDIDHGAVLGGYFGLVLLSASYISIGIFASSISNNQIVAILVALLISILFHFIFDVISNSFRGTLGQVFNYLGFSSHYESLSRGVIDSRDIIYFGSIIFIGLLFAQAVLSKRNWKD